MVGDWYRRSARQVSDYFTDWKNFGNEPAPNSMLPNGKGKLNCSMAVKARPLDCNNITIPALRMHGKRTRLRLINTSALTGFTLFMTGHLMTVIKVDGGNDVDSASAANSIGILYPGERVDVIVDKLFSISEDKPQLAIKLDKENLRFKKFALTTTQHFPIATGPHSHTPDSPLALHYNLANATPPKSITDLASTATRTILLYTKVEILAEYSNIPKGFINRTSWLETDPLTPPLLQTDRENGSDHFIPRIQASNSTWVDIVLNNMDEKGHPFHLHGTSFHILYTHQSPRGRHQPYNPYLDPTSPLNTVNPIKKDKVYVPGSGYVILRLRPDNPGLWLFHCHILWHHAVGMGIAFEIGDTSSSGNQTNTPPAT